MTLVYIIFTHLYFLISNKYNITLYAPLLVVLEIMTLCLLENLFTIIHKKINKVTIELCHPFLFTPSLLLDIKKYVYVS